MEPWLKIPEGRKTRSYVKRSLLIGLTVLLFLMLFAKFGKAAMVIIAAPL